MVIIELIFIYILCNIYYIYYIIYIIYIYIIYYIIYYILYIIYIIMGYSPTKNSSHHQVRGSPAPTAPRTRKNCPATVSQNVPLQVGKPSSDFFFWGGTKTHHPSIFLLENLEINLRICEFRIWDVYLSLFFCLV